MKLDEVLLETENLRLCRFVEETGHLIPSYLYTYSVLLTDKHKVELSDITLQELYNLYTTSVDNIKELNTGTSHFIGSCVLDNSTVNLLDKNYLLEKGLIPDNNITLQAYITYYDKSSWSGDTPEYVTPTDSIFYESGAYRNDYLAFQIAKLNKLTKDLNAMLYITRRGDSEYYITTALRIIDRPRIKLYKKNIAEFRDYKTLMDVPITVFYKWLMDNVLSELQKVSDADEESGVKAVYTLGDTHKLKSYYENNTYEEIKDTYGCFTYNNAENQSILKGRFIDAIEFSNSAKKELATGTVWESASYIAKYMSKFGSLNPNLTLNTFTKRFVNSSDSADENYQLYNEWGYGNFNDSPVLLLKGIEKTDLVLSRKNASVLHINTLAGDKPIALANIPAYNKVYDKMEDIPFITLLSWIVRKLSTDKDYDNFWEERENPDYDIGTGENKPDDNEPDKPVNPDDEWKPIEGLAITPLPIPPTRADPDNFDNRGDRFHSRVYSPFIAEINKYVNVFTGIETELAPDDYLPVESNDNVNGVKTFFKLPICSVDATKPDEFANKRVVDQIFAKLSSKPKLYSKNLSITLRKYKYPKGTEYCWTYINLPANSKGVPVSPNFYDVIITSGGLKGGLVTLPTYLHKDEKNQGLLIGFPSEGVPRNLYTLKYKLRANSDRYQDSDEYTLKWDYNVGKLTLIDVDNSININEADTMFPASKYQGIVGSILQLPDLPCGVYLSKSVLGYDPMTYSQDDETTSHGNIRGLRFTDIVASDYENCKVVINDKENDLVFNGFPFVKKQVCLNSWIGMKSDITAEFSSEKLINLGLSLNNCRSVQPEGKLLDPETLDNLFFVAIIDKTPSVKGYSNPKDLDTIAKGTRAQVDGLKVVPHAVSLKTVGISKEGLYSTDIDVLAQCKFITIHTDINSFRVDMNRSFPNCKPYSGYRLQCSAFDTVFNNPKGCVKRGSPSTLVLELGDSSDTTVTNARGDDRTTVRLRECDKFIATLNLGLGYTNSVTVSMTEIANGSEVVYTPPMNYIGIDRTMIEDSLYVSGTNNISVIPKATYKLVIDSSSPILSYFTAEYVNNLIIKLKVKPDKVKELKDMLKPNTYSDFKQGKQTYGVEIPFYTYYLKIENPQESFNRASAYMECAVRIDRALKLGVSQVKISSDSNSSLLRVAIDSSASINVKECANIPKGSELKVLPESSKQTLVMDTSYPLYLDRNLTVEKSSALEVSVRLSDDNTIYNPMNSMFMKVVGYLYPEFRAVIKSPDDEFPLYNSSWDYLKEEYPDETLDPVLYNRLIGQYSDELCGSDRVNTSYPVLIKPTNVTADTDRLDPTYYGFTVGKDVDKYDRLFVYAKPVSDLLQEGEESYILLYVLGLLNEDKADSYQKTKLTSSLELIKKQLLVTCSGLFTGLETSVDLIDGYLYKAKVSTSALKAINSIQPKINVRKLEEWSDEWLSKHKGYQGEPVAISTQDFLTLSDYQSYTYQRAVTHEELVVVNVHQPQEEVTWSHKEFPDMRSVTALYGYDLNEWNARFLTYSKIYEDPIYQDLEKLVRSQTDLAKWIRVDRVDYTDVEQIEKRVSPSKSQYEIGISSISTDIVKLEDKGENPYRIVLKYNINIGITVNEPKDYELDVLRFSLDETKLPKDMPIDTKVKLTLLMNSRHVIRDINNNLKIFYRTVIED